MFTKYEKGAEVEIDVVKRYESGAEVDADAVYKVVSGAEEEVWANTKLLDRIEKTTTTGKVVSPGAWGNKTTMTSLNDSGYVTYADEGTWYNPTIEMDYHGFMFYYTTSGEFRTASAGTLYAYGVRSDGTVETVGEIAVNTFDEGTAQAFSYTFTGGNYTKVGFRFTWQNWNVTNSPSYALELSNILIDGQKYITDSADDYNYGDT